MDAETSRFFAELCEEVANLKARVAALEQGFRLVETVDFGRPPPDAEGPPHPQPEEP